MPHINTDLVIANHIAFLFRQGFAKASPRLRAICVICKEASTIFDVASNDCAPADFTRKSQFFLVLFPFRVVMPYISWHALNVFNHVASTLCFWKIHKLGNCDSKKKTIQFWSSVSHALHAIRLPFYFFVVLKMRFYFFYGKKRRHASIVTMRILHMRLPLWSWCLNGMFLAREARNNSRSHSVGVVCLQFMEHIA